MAKSKPWFLWVPVGVTVMQLAILILTSNWIALAVMVPALAAGAGVGYVQGKRYNTKLLHQLDTNTQQLRADQLRGAAIRQRIRDRTKPQLPS